MITLHFIAKMAAVKETTRAKSKAAHKMWESSDFEIYFMDSLNIDGIPEVASC